MVIENKNINYGSFIGEIFNGPSSFNIRSLANSSNNIDGCEFYMDNFEKKLNSNILIPIDVA